MKIFACLFTLLFTAPVLAYGPDQASDRVWLTNVVIISAENLGHIEKGSVLIENERIARVERNQNAKPPAGAVVVDGKGQYLIPGLIDSHVHLASVPGMPFEQSKASLWSVP